ncbi:MAG: winged helix-turn-helix domain-containing protein [Candidatus Nitrosocaldus sp.]
MPKRTLTEISGLILIHLKDGPKRKAWIKQKLKVDGRTLNRCLDTLAKHGLIDISDGHIEITEKGLYFVSIYKEFIQLLDRNSNK